VRHPRAAPSSPSPSPASDVTVLLIEDDPSVTEVVASALAVRGYQVRTAATGRDALDAAIAATPDVVLLDLGLPDMDGVAVCRQLRTWSPHPIIVLSADGAEERKVAALDEGADDYVTKPFSMPELLARLRVAERHRRLAAGAARDEVIVVGDVHIDTAGRTVTIDGSPVELTRKEFDLLAALARNAGRVLTHGALLEHVWGDRTGATGSLRRHIAQLRRQLGNSGTTPRIESEPGTGYRLTLDDG
jgi:two-component system KDP operon response regulator KdpE